MKFNKYIVACIKKILDVAQVVIDGVASADYGSEHV